MLYLCESSSEHPIATSICKHVEAKMDTRLIKNKVLGFKNRDGEGVVADVEIQENNQIIKVLCGNKKLMNHFSILANYPELERNIGYLEQEGKTVVVCAVNQIP